METRQVAPDAFRAAELPDGKPGLVLRAITPRVVDDYGSLWHADAFDDHLGQRMPTLVWAHDWSEPLGPATGFTASNRGPEISFAFSDFEAVPLARRAHAQLKDGTLQDVSVGFRYLEGGRREPTKAEFERYPGVREVITRAAMDEVSLVLRGAVPGAKVLAVREAPDDDGGPQGGEGGTLVAISFRLARGGMIDADAVFEVARKVAAGELTKEEGDVALGLLATLEPAPVPDGTLEPAPVPPPDMAAELLALEAITEGA